MKPLSFPNHPRWISRTEDDRPPPRGYGESSRSDMLIDLRNIFWEAQERDPSPVRSVAKGDFSEAEIKAMEKLYKAKIARPAKVKKARAA